MRAAERGQEVIQRVLVGHVDRREVDVRLVVLLVEDVVLAQGHVEQAARRDARRVVVVVRRSRGRECSPDSSLYCEARQDRRKRVRGRGRDAVAGEPGFELLVGRQAAQIDSRAGRRVWSMEAPPLVVIAELLEVGSCSRAPPRPPGLNRSAS